MGDFSEFLPWLTEEQKMELRNMKEAGAQDKMGEKILEYYEVRLEHTSIGLYPLSPKNRHNHYDRLLARIDHGSGR